MTCTNQYKTCHECGHTGHRNGDEFRCANDKRRVTEYHADVNAVARLRPAGSQNSASSGQRSPSLTATAREMRVYQ